MADNTVLDLGSGGDTLATASVTFSGDTAKVQMCGIGIVAGAAESFTYAEVLGGAGAVAAGVQRMTLASDDPAVVLLGTIDADTGAIKTAVEIIDNIVSVTDAAAGATPTGVLSLGVRNDTASALAGTDGDFIPLSMDALGNARVALTDINGAELDYRSENDNWNAADHGILIFGRDTEGSPNKYRAFSMHTDGSMHVHVHDALPAGDNNIGNVDVVSSALPTGAATQTTLASIDGNITACNTGAVVLAGGTAIAGKMYITDGTDDVTIRDVTGAKAMDVSIVDGAGSQITTFGGGTQYTEDAAAAADPTGTMPVLVRNDTPASEVTADGDNIAQRATEYGAAYVQILDSSGNFINSFGGSGGTSATDETTFTAGAGTGTPAMGFFSADTVSANDVGVLAMDASRRLMVSIEADNAGIGGGIQYTEADTDASITGTAVMWEDAADTLRAVSDAKPLPVDLGSRNDVTVTSGAITETNSDAIKNAVELIDNAVSGAGFNITQLAGAAVPIGGGAEAAALLVTVANDSTGTLTVNTTGTAGLEVVQSVAADLNVTEASGVAIKNAVETIDNAISGSEMLIAGGATQTNDLKITLDSEAVVLGAGTAGIGKLTANDGVDIGDVDVATIAAGTNTVGGVIAQGSTSIAYNGTTPETIGRASGVAASGTVEIIAAVASRKFRVLALSLMATAATANSVYLATTTDTDVYGNAGNPIPMAMDADGDNVGGIVLPYNQGGWMETSTANESLDLILSAAVDIIWSVTWIEVA